MGGKRRIFVFAALLSVLLSVPLVFGLGIVDVPKFSSVGSSSAVEASSSASVFVDPDKNITDYEDPTHNVTIGNTVTFNMNISSVEDLFVWAINMSWDPAILNVSGTIPGEFLATSVNLTSSEELGWVINSTDNAIGCSLFAESILANVSGIGGSGLLVSIEFLILDYGHTNLTISVSGTHPTMLLNSTGDSLDFTATGGYFSNKIWGDMNGDRTVDGDDLTPMCGAYGSSPGDPEWIDACDINRDGIVDGDDLTPACGNYGRSV